jgi:hypothetical protein
MPFARGDLISFLHEIHCLIELKDIYQRLLFIADFPTHFRYDLVKNNLDLLIIVLEMGFSMYYYTW